MAWIDYDSGYVYGSNDDRDQIVADWIGDLLKNVDITVIQAFGDWMTYRNEKNIAISIDDILQWLETVKDHVPDKIMQASRLVRMVSIFTRLRFDGKNYRGVCPFHEDKAESFIISQSRAMWHCFMCGRGGTERDYEKYIKENKS